MKKIVSLLLALTLCFSLSTAVFAESLDIPEDEGGNELVIPGEQPRAEETEWYYRIYNNLIQRRLWSITYMYWKTDWITIGHV